MSQVAGPPSSSSESAMAQPLRHPAHPTAEGDDDTCGPPPAPAPERTIFMEIQAKQASANGAADSSSDATLLAPGDIRPVSPALDRYTQEALLGDVWGRPDLSPRDRSIVTLAALIARNQTIALPFYA